jgi:hypothetical protein
MRNKRGRTISQLKSYLEVSSKLDETTGCRNWIAGCSAGGYGAVYYNGKPRLAHRLVYELTHGNVTENKIIRHRCNNRKCIALEHLVIGTHADNMEDKGNAGTAAVSHSLHKLTEAQLKILANPYYTIKTIAELAGVSKWVAQTYRGYAKSYIKSKQPLDLNKELTPLEKIIQAKKSHIKGSLCGTL